MWRQRNRVRTEQSQVRRTEAGFAGGVEGIIFGMLLFIVGTLLVTNAWAVVDTKMALVAAAREAARAYVEAPNAQSAGPDAQLAANGALTGYGRAPSQATVQLLSGTFARCQRITIEVRYPASLIILPFLGRIGTAQWVRADHSELVDPYRSGLAGSSLCG